MSWQTPVALRPTPRRRSSGGPRSSRDVLHLVVDERAQRVGGLAGRGVPGGDLGVGGQLVGTVATRWGSARNSVQRSATSGLARSAHRGRGGGRLPVRCTVDAARDRHRGVRVEHLERRSRRAPVVAVVVGPGRRVDASRVCSTICSAPVMRQSCAPRCTTRWPAPRSGSPWCARSQLHHTRPPLQSVPSTGEVPLPDRLAGRGAGALHALHLCRQVGRARRRAAGTPARPGSGRAAAAPRSGTRRADRPRGLSRHCSARLSAKMTERGNSRSSSRNSAAPRSVSHAAVGAQERLVARRTSAGCVGPGRPARRSASAGSRAAARSCRRARCCGRA